MLCAFFWVITQCLNFICRRLTSTIPWLTPTHALSPSHTRLWSLWVVTFHSLFLYPDPPLLCHPPSSWLRLFFSQTFSCVNTPTFLKPSHSSYLPTYEDGTDRVLRTHKIQTPGNYPEESVQHRSSLFGHLLHLLCQ